MRQRRSDRVTEWGELDWERGNLVIAGELGCSANTVGQNRAVYARETVGRYRSPGAADNAAKPNGGVSSGARVEAAAPVGLRDAVREVSDVGVPAFVREALYVALEAAGYDAERISDWRGLEKG